MKVFRDDTKIAFSFTIILEKRRFVMFPLPWEILGRAG
jgi:hypothetical protein